MERMSRSLANRVLAQLQNDSIPLIIPIRNLGKTHFLLCEYKSNPKG